MSYDFDFSFLRDYDSDLVYGVWLTLAMTVAAIVPGFALGTTCAISALYGPAWLRRLSTAYVEGIRNTPLVIQVFWLFFGLSVLNIHVSATTAAITALVVNVGAYTAEIMRAGFETIPKGQTEAAACLAMTRTQQIWNIQLPQAVERMYPALVSQFVLMMLATSIMSQISAPELTGVGYQIQSFTFRGFEVYIVIAIIYLALASVLRLLLFGVATALFPRRRRLKTLL
jgi:polar amino acid transport system permease protein